MEMLSVPCYDIHLLNCIINALNSLCVVMYIRSLWFIHKRHATPWHFTVHCNGMDREDGET